MKILYALMAGATNIAALMAPGGPVTMNLAAYGADFTPGVTVRRLSSGNYDTVETADSLRPSLTGTVATFYVDNVVGLNGNAGTSLSPWLSVGTAYARTDADTIQIRVRPLATRICWLTRGGVGVVPAGKNIELFADDGGELIIAGYNSTSPPTITANGDGTYTLSSLITSTSTTHAGAPTQWDPTTRAERGGDPGVYSHVQGTATPASMQAGLLPGQSYRCTNMAANGGANGTNDTVFRPFGDRALATFTGYLIPTATAGLIGINTQLPAARGAGYTFWAKNVWVASATIGGLNLQTTATLRVRLIMSFGGGVGSSTNATAYQGSYDVFLFDGVFGGAVQDALNGHSGTNGAVGSGDIHAAYVRCRGLYTGYQYAGYSPTFTDGTQNLMTGHDGPAGTPTPVGVLGSRDIAVACNFLAGSNGRPVAYVGSGRAWLFGCGIGASSRSTTLFETVSAAGSAAISLVECTVAASLGSVDIDGSSTLGTYCYGMTQGALRTSGNVTFNAML